MALRKAFTAIDLASYRLPEEIPVEVFNYTYNPHLIAAPRIYGEEVTGLGAVWGGRDPNRFGPSSISFLAALAMIRWPSWAISKWRFDGQEGRLLDRVPNFSGAGAVQATYGRYCVEPDGTIWWYGDPYAAQAVAMDPGTLAANGGVILASDFGLTGLSAMAIDRGSDRVWIQITNGRVGLWKLSTKEKLADIYAPNEVRSITLTHDGFAYLSDSLRWLCVYDYEGRLRGAMRDIAPTAPKGVIYGWDHYYKRLLRVAGTAEATDGASTLRVEGLYPQPEAWTLTPPIPLKVPRKGRTVYSFAHLAGEGGEPLAGRRLTFTAGAVSSTVATDANGDARVPLTPSATGALLVEVTE